MKKYAIILLVPIFIIVAGCSTTKTKDEQGKFKKFYHNTTSKYNGYFNAEEIMSVTMMELEEQKQENYNKILPIYHYTDLDNPTAIAPQMDAAIEKVIKVATIHDLGNYVDDCYVLMGKAQFMKQDYASAEETFQYFEEEFDPKNPYGREYQKNKFKKKSAKERKKEMQEERKEKDDERKEEQKVRDKKRKDDQKARDEEKKRRQKASKKRKKSGTRTRTPKTSEDETPKKKRLTAEEKAEIKAEEAEQKEKENYEKEKAKLKEAEEELKRKANRPQGEGGVFENRTAYYKGLYWLARTYIETERFSAATHILDRLDATDPLEDKVAAQIPAARAHLFIKSKEYDAALAALDNAIDLEEDKGLKARYAFIKGQIYETKGAESLAYTEYKRAKNFSKAYELKFNAELNELKLSYKTGQTSRASVEKKLDKMLREAKNLPYEDQIYFTMAQVKLDDGDIDGAIEDFGFALEATGGNKNVKVEAFYKLAELLYEQGIYRDAKANYDKALESMSLADDRYKKVQRLAESLTDIANNMETLELQDSLLKMSTLSDEELRELAEKQLKEQAELAAAAPTTNDRANPLRPSGGNRQLGAGRSNFFAYNPIALNQGKLEFKRKWRDRVYEDNWRRSLRTDATTTLGNLDEEDEEIAEITDEQIQSYLRNVPKSETQLKATHIKIQNALFNLGVQFRERLQNYDKSIEVLERLINDYPDFEKKDEALFHLYLSYQDKGEMAAAQKIKSRMQTEFPDSNFTKLALDPNYAKKMRTEEDNIGAYYEKTYQLFENKKYQAVLERAEQKSKLFQNENQYDAKFDLLVAMSQGSLEGKERYVKELQGLIRRHKGTPEEIRASEILRFLNGDTQAFDEILYEEGLDKFVEADDKLHYVFLVIYDQNKFLNDIKIGLSDYHKKFHRIDKLSITDIVLNTDNKSHIILVRKFDDKTDAMNYVKGTKKNEKEFINKGRKNALSFEIYAATQKNYREVVKQRTTSAYREFHKEKYEK